MKQRSLSWKESDFERWFMEKPFLPGKERVLVISKQRSFRRVVDLLALDKTGGLVIIEVKNERSTRAAIGQSLEYLAQYADTALADLEEDYSRLMGTSSSLGADFRKAFNRRLTVTPRRRAYLVAPSFDSHSAVCVRYLSDQLLGGRVQYRLIRSWREGGGFRIEPYECPPFTHAGNLRQGLALTPGRRLFYVLEPGRQPVMWYIGRVGQGGLRLASGPALSRGSLQVVSRMLIPEERAGEVDVSQSGTVWQHRDKLATSAKLVGRVRARAQSGQLWFAVLARFVNGRFVKFQRRPWTKFAASWRHSETELPGWRGIIAAARSELPVGR